MSDISSIIVYGVQLRPLLASPMETVRIHQTYYVLHHQRGSTRLFDGGDPESEVLRRS